MSLRHRPLPLPIRLANRAGALLDRAGLRLLPIEGDALLAAVAREVGVRDLGGSTDSAASPSPACSNALASSSASVAGSSGRPTARA